MKDSLEKIYEKNVNNTYVIDKEGVLKSMEDAYNLGIKETFDWLSKMDYLSDNIQYLIEEWKNQNNNKL